MIGVDAMGLAHVVAVVQQPNGFPGLANLYQLSTNQPRTCVYEPSMAQPRTTCILIACVKQPWASHESAGNPLEPTGSLPRATHQQPRTNFELTSHQPSSNHKPTVNQP
jgi:hypothetical protein